MKFTMIVINDELEIVSIDLVSIDNLDGDYHTSSDELKKEIYNGIVGDSDIDLHILTNEESEKLNNLVLGITDSNTQKITYDVDEKKLEIIDLSNFATFENLDTDE